MFTSRAEYRLSLREDNADLRLTAAGRKLGLVDDKRWDSFLKKQEIIENELERLRSSWLNPRLLAPETIQRLFGEGSVRETTLADLLKRPGLSYSDVAELIPGSVPVSTVSVAQQVEINIKYQGYIDRQQEEIERQHRFENLPMPASLDYAEVRGLSNEVKQKLNLLKPETLGQASRISGITPAAISLLLVHLKRGTATNRKSA
jgi:tRNA uridine 5-carboxymethylaminomethyl modification enzyme